MIQQITFDLECAQGATFKFEFAYKDPDGQPIDLTGFSAAMDVRKTPSSAEPLVRLSTPNGRISLRGQEGVIALEIDAGTTAGFTPGAYRYDLLLRSPTETVRLLRGLFVVDASATKL